MMLSFILLFFANIWGMQNEPLDLASQIQCGPFRPQKIGAMIFQSQNINPPPYWPILLHPDTDDQKEPQYESDSQTIFIYWKKFKDIG